MQTKESAIRAMGGFGVSRSDAQNLIENYWPQFEMQMATVGDTRRRISKPFTSVEVKQRSNKVGWAKLSKQVKSMDFTIMNGEK